MENGLTAFSPHFRHVTGCRELQFEPNDGDACAARLFVFVLGAGDQIDRTQVFADFFFQCAGAFAVQDAHFGEAEHDGVVDKFLRRVEGFGSTHAPYVDLLAEVHAALGGVV